MAATKSSFPAVVVLRAPTHLFRHESTALSKSFVALPKSPSLSLIRPQLKIFAIFSSSPPIPTQTLPNLAQTPDTASALVVMIVVGIAITITIQLSKILAPKTPQFSLKLEGSLRDPVPFSLELFYSSGSSGISEWGPGPAAMPIVVVSAVLVIRGLFTWLANIPWELAMRHLLIIPPGDLTLKLAFLLLDMLWHLARRPRSH